MMRRHPDPMIVGLVCDTLSLVCAKFQNANVFGSSYQSPQSQCNVGWKGKEKNNVILRLRTYNESLLQRIGTSDH